MKNDEMTPKEAPLPGERGRICVITALLTTGGSDSLLHAIWTRMRQRGYAVDLYSMLPATRYPSLTENLSKAGIRVHQPAGWLRSPLIALGLLFFLPNFILIPIRARFQPDPILFSLKNTYRRIEPEIVIPIYGAMLAMRIQLVHWHRPYNLISGYHDATCRVLFRLKKRLEIPVCYTEISSPKWRRMVAPKKNIGGLLNSFDRILVPSENIGRELQSYEGLTTPYSVIPFFVDLPDWTYIPPQRSARTLGCIGRFSREKNQDLLIRLYGEVMKLVPDARLILVGNGPQAGEFKSLAMSLGLSQNIEFIDHFDDIREMMERIDIFILLSDAEGMPISLIEALYFGKPVIATPVGSIPEMIIPGYNGYIFPKEAFDEIAHVVARLMQDDTAFREMSKNNRRAYTQRFDPEKQFQLLYTVYKDLIRIS